MTTYVGWQVDRKKAPRANLADAIACFEEKTGGRATEVLVSPQMAHELATPTRQHPGELSVTVKHESFMATGHLYVTGEVSA